MSEIEDLHGRLAVALDRIAQGLDRSSQQSGADPAEVEALRQELEDERIAGEQLKERLKQLRKRRERLEAELDAARQAATEVVARVDAELHGLREANARLREINARLREANETGVGEPHLINKAMMAELEALRASQSADRAEAEAVYAELAAALDSVKASNRAEDA